MRFLSCNYQVISRSRRGATLHSRVFKFLNGLKLESLLSLWAFKGCDLGGWVHTTWFTLILTSQFCSAVIKWLVEFGGTPSCITRILSFQDLANFYFLRGVIWEGGSAHHDPHWCCFIIVYAKQFVFPCNWQFCSRPRRDAKFRRKPFKFLSVLTKPSKFQHPLQVPSFNPKSNSKFQSTLQVASSKFQYKFHLPIRVPSFNFQSEFQVSTSNPSSNPSSNPFYKLQSELHFSINVPLQVLTSKQPY